MYKIVLFDLDGTLLDTDLLLVLTWVELHKRYHSDTFPRLDDIVTFSGPPIKDSLKKTFPNEDIDELYEKFNEISRPLYDKYLCVYPGGKELIFKLKKQGVKVGVVTSKHKIPALHAFDLVGLSDAFDVVITADDVIKTKPDKEGIEKAIAKIGNINKDEVLYIGDNAVDYYSSKNANIDSMIVTWGPRKLDKNISPTYYLDSFDKFFEVVKNG